jgi:nicotinamidase-related amidase
MAEFDPKTTALVLIDLQNGIVGMPLAPRSGPDVLAAGQGLAERFRKACAPVVLVNVAWASDFADAPKGEVDQANPRPEGGLPAEWSALVEGLAQPGDILVQKRNWGAFYGTDLDLHLRRRGIRTIVIGGIATNFGVESTVRNAWELGYSVVVVEDACATTTAELHGVAIKLIFPRIAKVAVADDIGFAKT